MGRQENIGEKSFGKIGNGGWRNTVPRISESLCTCSVESKIICRHCLSFVFWVQVFSLRCGHRVLTSPLWSQHPLSILESFLLLHFACLTFYVKVCLKPISSL